MKLAELENALHEDADASRPDLAAIHRLGDRVRRRRALVVTASAAAVAAAVGGLGWATLGAGPAGEAGPASGGSPSASAAAPPTSGWPAGVPHGFNQITANATLLDDKPATHITGQTAAEIRRVTYHVVATHKTYTTRTVTSGGLTTFSIVIPVPDESGTSGEQSALCIGATSWTVYVGTPEQLARVRPAMTCDPAE